MSSGLTALCLLFLHTGALGFKITPGKSLNHLEITERAILDVTVQVCRALAQAEGTDFTFPVRIYFYSVILPEMSYVMLCLLLILALYDCVCVFRHNLTLQRLLL